MVRPQPIVLTSALFLLLLLSGCPSPSDPQQNREAPKTPVDIDVNALEASLEKGEAKAALEVAIRGTRAIRNGEAEAKIGLLVAKTLRMAWLHLATAEASHREPPPQWLEVAMAATRLGGPAAEGPQRWRDGAAQLRTTLRPLLRDPEHSKDARAITQWLNLIASEEDAEAFIHPDVEDDFAITLTLLLHLVQALEEDPPWWGASPLRIANALPHLCPRGLSAMSESTSAAHTIDALRKRCALACTPQTLGLGAPPPPPLTPEVYLECPNPKGIMVEEGTFLSVKSFWALSTLVEAQRLLRTLQDASIPPELKPLLPQATTLSKHLINHPLAGGLPFLDDQGPLQINLPLQSSESEPHPTPVVLTLHEQDIWLSVWPRFWIGEDLEVHASTPGFPGRSVRAAALTSALQPLWAAHPDAPKEVTLVADRNTSLQTLKPVVQALKRAQVGTLRVATWPPMSPLATSRSLAMELGNAPRHTPRLVFADGDARLYDTLNRPEPIAIFAVADFVPDLVEHVQSYANTHPAIQGLILQPDPALTLDTLIKVVDGLRIRRSGETMASTAHLLSAEPIYDRRGAPLRILWPMSLEL